jgi:glyceraldehyde 3-phosphate dehydrogenase
MTKLKVAINGFGRIGRTFFRAASQEGLDIVGINDLQDPEQLAYLLKHDSSYGNYPGEVVVRGKGIEVDGKLIPITNIKEPQKLPWSDLKVDFVVESTGVFRSKDQAELHLKAGAKNVLVTAPAKGEEKVKTIVHGVNHLDFNREKDQIISFASCTTNCLTPLMMVLEESFGVEQSFATTIHSYTSSQSLQDGPGGKDYRRGRAAAVNIVPTSTGANKATELVYPKVEGRLGAMAVRVPSLTVSLVDLVANLKKETTAEEVNQVFEAAAKKKNYQGVVGVTNEPLVSSDLKSAPNGAVVDLPLTQMVGGNLVKIIAWYDNEMGYSIRMAKFCKYLENNS